MASLVREEKTVARYIIPAQGIDRPLFPHDDNSLFLSDIEFKTPALGDRLHSAIDRSHDGQAEQHSGIKGIHYATGRCHYGLGVRVSVIEESHH